MPVRYQTNSRNLRTIAQIATATLILTAVALLWWPSIPGWSAITVGTGLLWLNWLIWRTVDGRTEVPANPVHAALTLVVALATWQLVTTDIHGGSGQANSLGQFGASLIFHLAMLALMIILTQDLLAGKTLKPLPVVAFGLALLAGAFMGLIASTRAEGRLMLGMTGWTGLAITCWPAWVRYRGPAAAIETTLQKLGRRAWLAGTLIVAAALAIASPPAAPLATTAVALTLAMGIVCMPTRRKLFAIAAAVAGMSAVAHAWSLGWIDQPDWPRDLAGWFGSGGAALLKHDPWDSNLALLTGTVGWAGAIAMLAVLAFCLLRTLLSARRAGVDGQVRALLSVLAMILATMTWLAPGGLFTPSTNILFAAVWAFWPTVTGRPAKTRSGWWVLMATLFVAAVSAVVRQVGLLAWVSGAQAKTDDRLHLVIGWTITQMLLWLLNRRRFGWIIAVATSIAIAAGGEMAQRLFTERSAQMDDFLNHCQGVAIALAIYCLCKACLKSETTDMTPARAHAD